MSAEIESASRIAALERDAQAIVDASVATNTRLAFDQDWTHWERFCAREGIPVETVSPGALVGFVTWLAHDTDEGPASAPSTISRRLSGVLDGWRRRGLPVPHGITRGARRVLTRYESALAEANVTKGYGKAPALTVRDLRRISVTLPDTLVGVRDRALLVVGFGFAARRSELANLLVDDVTVTEEGLSVMVRHSKVGRRNPAIPRGSEEHACPVRTWRAWLKASDISDGHAFRRIGAGDTVRGQMTGGQIAYAFERAGKLADLDVRLRGHSVRSGLATEARRAGHDAKTIAEQGGWKPNSQTLYGYMHIVDRWSDNAMRGVL